MHSMIWLQQAVLAATSWTPKTLAVRAQEALPGVVPIAGFQVPGFIVAACYMAMAVAGIGALVTALGFALIYIERKLAGHFQCRLGPMRVGPHGVLQTVADTVKLLMKEDIIPEKADQLMHLIAPFFSMMATVIIIAVVPYSPLLHVVDFNIGVLFITAVSGFGVIGILLGGWSSNNKWSLVGAMRAGAQIISYEVSATLALLVVVLFSGSMSMSGIVESQAAGWWVWRAHGIGIVAFVIYLIASTAEINRTPFDIPEGESELTAGFHTEYSGIRFSFFFLAEFINMFVVAALTATFFLGGWMPFHIGNWQAFNGVMDLIPPVVWFMGKAGFVIFLIMWFRWTFPRMRVDQLMNLEWKILLPIGFVNLIAAAVAVLCNLYLFPGA